MPSDSQPGLCGHRKKKRPTLSINSIAHVCVAKECILESICSSVRVKAVHVGIDAQAGSNRPGSPGAIILHAPLWRLMKRDMK